MTVPTSRRRQGSHGYVGPASMSETTITGGSGGDPLPHLRFSPQRASSGPWKVRERKVVCGKVLLSSSSPFTVRNNTRPSNSWNGCLPCFPVEDTERILHTNTSEASLSAFHSSATISPTSVGNHVCFPNYATTASFPADLESAVDEKKLKADVMRAFIVVRKYDDASKSSGYREPMGPLKASTSHSVPLTKDDECHPALSNPPPASLQVASSKVSLVLPRRSGGRRSCDCCNALAPPRPAVVAVVCSRGGAVE